MDRNEYEAYMEFLISKKNQKLLPDNTKKEYFGLDFTTRFCHKSGVWVEKSLKNNTVSLSIETSALHAPEQLVLINKLENLIFDFLDEQENR